MLTKVILDIFSSTAAILSGSTLIDYIPFILLLQSPQHWWVLGVGALLFLPVVAFERSRAKRLKQLRVALSVSETLRAELTHQRAELGRASRALAIDYAITRALAESATPAEAAPRILQTICISTGWEIGVIWNLDAQAGVLRCVDVWHTSDFSAAQFEALTRDFVFSPGVGLPGRVLSTREPHWIRDLAADNNFPRFAIAAQEGLRSGFGFPILLEKEVIGVLEFFSREIRPPVHDDFVMMSSIGSHIGQLIERKLTEESLRESEEKYRTILDNIHDSYYEVDLAGNLVFFNDALCEVLGYSREELIGQSYRVWTDERNAQKVRQIFNNVYKGVAEPDQAYEFEIVRKDGAVRYGEVSVSVIKNAKNRVVGFRGILRDVTSRKQAEELRAWNARFSVLRAEVGIALAENEELPLILQRCTEAVVRNLAGAFARIWLLNHEQNVLELQASAGLYTHIDGPHSRIPVGHLKIGYIAQTSAPVLTNDFPTDPHVSDEQWAERERMVAFAGFPLSVENRVVGVIAMFAQRELTQAIVEALGSVADTIAQGIERKRAAEALRKSREERFLELQRVRARIATDLHDDIGSSLTQISILSEVAQRFSDAKKQPAGMNPFEQLTTTSSELVKSMSDIVWAINPTKDRLVDLVQRMRRFSAEVLTARKIDFSFAGPDTAAEIPLGANLRREVLLVFKESIHNIVKHSHCAHAEIELCVKGDRLNLKVSDDGEGFNTQHGLNTEGHGLLSMQRRAECLGGAMKIHSQKGLGTTVHMSIPIPPRALGV